MATYRTRWIEKTLKIAAKQFPALILTGPRQSGKTTLFHKLFDKTHRYVSLDDLEMRRMAIQDPALFIKNFEPPIIIDEIQYAPDLLPYLKIWIDAHRSKKGQIILTGSQMFPLMKGVTESLAGRAAILTLLSFAAGETKKIAQTMRQNEIQNFIFYGGYPELVLARKRNSRLWFSSYLQTYLERDLRQIQTIGSLTDFQRFLELLATRHGQVLHLSQISNDLGVAVNTVKRWVSVLEATHQICLVKPYFKNAGKRLVKAPRVYFLDSGLLCYLQGVSSSQQALAGMGAGQRFEGLVISEIIRRFYAEGESPRVYWWRTSNGDEVDFVIEISGRLYPIEVKMSSKESPGLARGALLFQKLFKQQVERSYLVNFSTEQIEIAPGLFTLPWQDFLAGDWFRKALGK